ncbi:VapC toxin family PIN domain ribonuclease [Mesorhizobium sp.]|uniref:VapC toxin family PIN domain ribonuclease n=1 Tax=Mesorhizobium sp. TaxID=1871066 RepID=UPI000FE97FF5|nr:VapC toxin family PIN domain ribonuclease [Mesorhizobium sp.]RWI12716.1 MAG: VapC toxin family PIN domain ribonuclease [Mesorhizobium sp.]RWM84780.1 MAG: VapC toxin family PIN domain ribonuclease [Mesorhizobium sp.]TIP79886.1 MAG: type II toxin-antitoxin system VapC family toxin [Mesorhizobium sp.]TIP94104.1 MAG: type II toxin-antitoxin system VapC family toxin [Mesorhizobium sp.]TJW56551.1 MAG: type II toxin-antitoxin system VapC family toxin [Mesorhizobium sp.]
MANGTEEAGFDENSQAQFDASARKTQLRAPAKRERVRLAKLIDRGRSMEEAADDLASLGMPVAVFDEMVGIAAGQLRELTRHRGLSLGVRACLALAIRENAIAVTADRDWGDLDIGCKIELIR